jgi:L-fuculose-phosphate aldolase
MQGSDTNEARMRQEIVEVCRLMYQRNLIAASDGNVSVRWGERYLITTPTGLYKGFLRPEDLVVTDLDGQLAPEDVAPRNGYGPSAELRLHLEVYRQRPDVCAVVHAHPPITTALTVAGVSLAPCIVPETLVTLGSIVTTAYATPTSSQGPEVIRPYIRDHDALVLDRHGAVTVGDTVFSAYAHMEKVEHTAQVILAARQAGRIRTLPLDEVRRLSAMRDAALRSVGRSFEGPDCHLCGACEGLGQRAV